MLRPIDSVIRPTARSAPRSASNAKGDRKRRDNTEHMWALKRRAALVLLTRRPSLRKYWMPAHGVSVAPCGDALRTPAATPRSLPRRSSSFMQMTLTRYRCHPLAARALAMPYPVNACAKHAARVHAPVRAEHHARRTHHALRRVGPSHALSRRGHCRGLAAVPVVRRDRQCAIRVLAHALSQDPRQMA